MLEGLEQIDWASLSHAYGPADDIPDRLRQLLSDDADVRDEALSFFFQYVWHQGTVYVATPYVVPFIIEMIQNTETPNRDRLLDYLSCIVTATPVWWAYDLGIMTQHEMLEDIRKSMRHVEDSCDAVRQGWQTYIDLLKTENLPIFVTSMDLLFYMVDDLPRTLPHVIAISSEVQHENKMAIISSLIVKHIDLLQRHKAITEELLGTLRIACSRLHTPVARLRCAQAVLRLEARQRTPQSHQLVEMIVDIAVKHPDIPSPVEEADEYSHEIITRHLTTKWLDYATWAASLQPDLGIPTLKSLLNTAKTPIEAHYVAVKLMDVAFKWNPRTVHSAIHFSKPQVYFPRQIYTTDESIDVVRAQGLASDAQEIFLYPEHPINPLQTGITDTQRDVIETLLESEMLWEVEHNLFALYGMPSSRQKLREALRQLNG